jgi:arsenical pump membrane protein
MLSVSLIFLTSCLATIGLTLTRPYLYIRTRKRQLRLDTYFLGALLGPLLILAGGLLTGPEIVQGLNGTETLQPLGILALFISMVFMSIFLDITGFFEACARYALSKAKTDGVKLFLAVYIAVSLLTLFTSNDIVILTFTPFVYYFAKHAGINPKPYLVAEFFAANTWSMALYIGNPTNILVASAFRFTFVGYSKWMILPTLAAGLANALLLYLIFRKEIRKPITPVALDPWEAITDKPGALLGLLLMFACIAALAVAPYLGIPHVEDFRGLRLGPLGAPCPPGILCPGPAEKAQEWVHRGRNPQAPPLAHRALCAFPFRHRVRPGPLRRHCPLWGKAL